MAFGLTLPRTGRDRRVRRRRQLGSADRPTGHQPFASGNSPAQASYPAPSFDFTLFDGNQLALSDLRGKAVVLNFWASWCPPCKEEARDLEQAWESYQDRGVVFVGVDIQDTEEDALAFIKEYGITYPNGQDTSGDIAARYGITGVPETFFITKDGKVNRHWIGAINERQLSAFITELLK